jgi:hypothetical protein
VSRVLERARGLDEGLRGKSARHRLVGELLAVGVPVAAAIFAPTSRHSVSVA